jgi:hypothetical protein
MKRNYNACHFLSYEFLYLNIQWVFEGPMQNPQMVAAHEVAQSFQQNDWAEKEWQTQNSPMVVSLMPSIFWFTIPILLLKIDSAPRIPQGKERSFKAAWMAPKIPKGSKEGSQAAWMPQGRDFRCLKDLLGPIRIYYVLVVPIGTYLGPIGRIY